MLTLRRYCPWDQGSGVDYFMIVEAEKVIKSKGQYTETELMWQGDFNPKMLNISKNLGAEQSRNLITYAIFLTATVLLKGIPCSVNALS